MHRAADEFALGDPPRRRGVVWVFLLTATLAILAADLVGFTRLTEQSEPEIAGVERFAIRERGHTTEPVAYDRVPPAGGPHDPALQNCGVYAEPLRNENAVHSLEHGAVWLTYRPGLPAWQLDMLSGLIKGKHHTLLSPYPGLPATVVATAWGRQLALDDPADPRIARFLDFYRAGPQAVEKGAPCDGGVGNPLP
ncbi:hypothetical protein GCM10027598_78140 [Amycolatopsis oliviviridis]|uniref:DUF3105 domain-containing protein n=1 Tax=Amycolatopsis oliviviridis TaxID=1471590 RepID=A0ABQ3L4Z3_9PSEU|nr:DUF3105 domain-containing protein [Amycolatopsis oliviviridis]GHH04813.1 hypothetical protein GCM10017790_08080 [Amycolatopsis oliviviridis]